MPETVIQKVRQALGRSEPLQTAPVPPPIDEPIVRLVHSDFGLSDLFSKTAGENGILVESVSVDDVAEKLIDFLRGQNVKRIAIADSPMLKQIGLLDAMSATDLDVKTWNQITLDQLYDFDAGITDVYAAVAEIGGIAVRASAGHGRALSLVPPIHIAIVEPKNFLPDLLDLLQKMNADGVASSTSIITGPSKTSDIEMTLVVGVHGPVLVKIFILA